MSKTAKRVRLDAELVRRGLARSRAHAAELIAAGRVQVRGTVASKPATAVERDAAVLVSEDAADENWASRGAAKLLGALDAFPMVTVRGKRCLDAGASTGGFTDVLLRRCASQVVAVDVGRGLLLWRLQTDPRVVLRERVNVRYLTPEDIGGPVELIVADLSFISLGLVLPALTACAAAGADLLPMVKPQFEVGRRRVGAGGVVRDPALRAEAVTGVVRQAADLGWALHAAVASPLPGPSGNVEYFVWLRQGEPPPADHVAEIVRTAVAEGPR